MHITNEWLEDVLQQDACEKKIVKVADWSAKSAVGKGENFTGSINRVLLDTVLGNGKKTKMSVIVKNIAIAGPQANFFSSERFFNTEIKLYEEILPLMEDVLKEQGVPALWPSLLGKKGDYLVFSDLQSKNYQMKCRQERLDMDHSVLTMKTLALFHSAGVVLRERGMLDITDLEYSFILRSTKSVRKFSTGGVRQAAKTILAYWGPEWQEIGQRMYRKSYTLGQDLDELRKIENSGLNVLCHGDLWTTNIMFKYSKGLDIPIGLRFIDFQISHYNSYAYDLIYLIHCGIPAEMRRTSLEPLLVAYTSTLADTLQSYGYGHLAPTLQMVQDELKRLSLYSFVVLMSVMPIVTTSADEAMNFDRLISDDNEDIPQNPEAYEANFKDEVSVELLKWAKEGLF